MRTTLRESAGAATRIYSYIYYYKWYMLGRSGTVIVIVCTQGAKGARQYEELHAFCSHSTESTDAYMNDYTTARSVRMYTRILFHLRES